MKRRERENKLAKEDWNDSLEIHASG